MNPLRQPTICKQTGLASLETVLVLPFLMLLMSVIVVFGYAASWKIRTETMARDVVWRARWHRFANVDARPPEWPAPATMDVGPGQPVESFASESIVRDPIIAGPLPAIEVNANLLDFTRGMLEGRAHIEKPPPLFAKLATYDFQVDHPILDDRFQHRQMGIWNYTRRFPLIYRSGMDSIRSSPAIQAAVSAIETSPYWQLMAALDRDPDFIAAARRPPDFYPRVPYFASKDRNLVTAARLNPLIEQIKNVPLRMGQATIRLYSEQLIQRPELRETIQAIRIWLNSLQGNREGRP